jgi:hypothetical protein
MTRSPFRVAVLPVLCAIGAAMSWPILVDAASTTDHRVEEAEARSPYDPDGDGNQGEATAIKDRVAEYHRRHAIDGRLTSHEMYRRARWSYDRWLASENERINKGIEGDGWISLGPVNGAGRASSLAPHPTNPSIVLAGSASGGVWKTVDGGETWYPTTDGLSDLAVGAVAFAPSDPDIVYLGSGEGDTFEIPGIGLLRSEDGGETWILPATEDDVMAEFFFDLAVHPTDADRVVAGTNRGIISTDDGGATWEIRLVAQGGSYGFTDIQRSSSNPDLLYAAQWCGSGCPGSTARIMKSIDGGLTWAPTGNEGLATRGDSLNNSRVSLAVAPSDDQILYVAANIDGNVNGFPYGDVPKCGIYRSDDGGETWTLTADPGPFLSPQGFYNNIITVKPTDPDVVLAGGVWYVRTTDGGQTWTTTNPYDLPSFGSGTATVPHVDAHAFAWQGSTLWVGCDGGVWRSTNDGAGWQIRNTGLVTRQNYGIAIDPVNRERILGGTQDNGTARRNDEGDDTWSSEVGGDGAECAINPIIDDIMYATTQYTSVYRRTPPDNRWKTISPNSGDEDAPFVTPLTMHPAAPNVLFTGTETVWKTDDGGSSWFALGTGGTWNTGTVNSIAVTAADPDRILVSKGSSAVYSSRDGGRTWKLGLVGRLAHNVEISPHDPDLALASMTTSSSGLGGILRSTNGGQTWGPSGTGLPPFNIQVARWDPIDPDVVYAGTDVGLYRSTDTGVTWARYGDGLPASSIHDIRILPDGSMLRVGTYGRGVWELNIDRPDNTPPTVEITEPTSTVVVATVGDPLELSAHANDADGDEVNVEWILTRDWTRLDGGSGTGDLVSNVSTAIVSAGQYQVAALATDAAGAQASDWFTVVVSDPADACATPLVLPGDGPFPVTVVTSNRTGTVEDTDPTVPCVDTVANGEDAGRQGSTWFEFTPDQTGTYAISTCNSTADTVLSVWTGDSCGPYENLACNDDDEQEHCFGPRTDSYLELGLDAGSTYRIMVGAWVVSARGDFRLQVDCLSCAASEDRLYIVPAASHAPGAEDTTWVTDLQLLNPGEGDAEAALAFLPAGGDNSGAAETTTTLSAGTAVEYLDVVSGLLGRDGSGAIRIRTTTQLLVASRTYNTAAAGTYGQFIPGVSAETAVAPGATTRLVGLVGNDSFRTNLGFANTTDQAATATITLRDVMGTAVSIRTETLEPFGWLQINRVFSGLGAVNAAVAEIRNDSASAELQVYASVVDGTTGDPIYVTAVPEATPGSPVWLTAAAHANGVGTSVWRTDIFVANPSDDPATATLTWVGPSGQPSALATVEVAAGAIVRLDDAVSGTFGKSGSGAIRVATNAGRLEVTSRTYNQAETGTYGQFIPGVLESAALGTGELAYLPQLRQDDNFRTNVGFLNLSTSGIVVDVEYFDGTAGSLGTVSYTVPASSWMQANQAPPADLASGFARLRSSTPNAKFFVYASVVDRGSDDPVFIPATESD